MPYYAQPSSSKTDQAAWAGASGSSAGWYQGQSGWQTGQQQSGQQWAGQQQGWIQEQQLCNVNQGQQQLAGQGGQWVAQPPQQYGTGYGQRYLAPTEIQIELAGKPTFYDNIRGIQWDGQRAWYYDSTGAPGARNSWSSTSVTTAIEQPGGQQQPRLGNGTEGDYAVHRAHPSSVYYSSPFAL